MKYIQVAIVAVLLLVVAAAEAGTIDPALQAKMDQTAADQPISVIVNLTDQAPIAQLDADLHGSKATRQARHREIVLALKDASRSQDALQAELDQRQRNGGVIGYTSYWISNLMVVYAVKGEIERIAARPDVDVVELNFKAELIEPVSRGDDARGEESGSRGIGVPPGIRAIHGPEVWYQLGYTGAGRLIGSLDTGVDGNHPALASRWRGNFHPASECWLDVLGGSPNFPTDTNNHGTHTTGTMTGKAPDDTIGIAWGAQWIACNAINQGVSGELDNDIITAFQWFADPDGNPNTIDDVPDVVQNSWGVTESFWPQYDDCDTRWWAVIDNCEAAGVVTCWSAGNEGSSPQTMRSPADRATTLTNTFSVGAVNATAYNFPYPIAGFSSRGPSGCTGVPPENLIKPEVCAPGVDVYSSVPGGGFQDGWDGTSMAGPHVAGIVALLREANPDLEVDAIKQILMETARDEGTAGEDNSYGWGFVDAYEAVILATVGFGRIEGTVTNASYGGAPIEGAMVELLERGYQYTSDNAGFYSGSAAADVYTAQASAPGFSTEQVTVEVASDQTTVQDFALTDIAGPTISNVTQEVSTSDPVGPYVISADVVDFSTVADVKLYYRSSGSGWMSMDMAEQRGHYEASIPGQPPNTRIDYYVWAEDGITQSSVDPEGAPTDYYSLYVTEEFYAYAGEDPNDPNWQLGMAGDNATTGIWIRDDPVGTDYNGLNVQPEDDHTPAPGVKCFVTGNTPPGGAAGDNDVDNGCTSLRSPIMDLSGVEKAFITYWRWYGQGGSAVDDEFAVDVSSNGGTSWLPLERVPGNENSWQQFTVDLSTLIPLTSQVVIRFQACDLNSQGLVEAAIDDFAIQVFSQDLSGVPDEDQPVRPGYNLAQNRPNPFNPSTTISFALPQAGHVELAIYALDGRRVATLVDGELPAGPHAVIWRGQDQQGRQVASGSYFYRFAAGDYRETRRMLLVK